MSARNGKIARLPRPVRDELNRRLECSEESPELLDWLNALPEVQEILKEHFEGAPITKQNLSHWRQGGFQEALARRDLAQDAHDLTELANEVSEPEINAELADNAAIVLAARLGALVANWNGEADEPFAAKAKIFAILGRTVAQLQRQIHQARRDSAELKAKAEEKVKAVTAENRKRAQRRILDQMQAPALAKQFGKKGLEIIEHFLALHRGEFDDALGPVPALEEQLRSVQVGQGGWTGEEAPKTPEPKTA